jgi:hypothetical protein
MRILDPSAMKRVSAWHYYAFAGTHARLPVCIKYTTLATTFGESRKKPNLAVTCYIWQVSQDDLPRLEFHCNLLLEPAYLAAKQDPQLTPPIQCLKLETL